MLKKQNCSAVLVLIYFSCVCLWVHLISHSHSCLHYYRIHTKSEDKRVKNIVQTYFYDHISMMTKTISFSIRNIILLIFLSETEE